MPTRHFLSAPECLSQQVAQFLSGADKEGTVLITPTAGAARSIRQRLQDSGAKPPSAAQPMRALLPDRENIATPVERCLAWAQALKNASTGDLQILFWKQAPQTTVEFLKAGRNFNKLCDRLAEAGLSPCTLQLPSDVNGSIDQGRWSAIATIYQTYLTCLTDWSLHDPNNLRLEEIQSPQNAIPHIVIAGLPDLPRAFEQYASQLEKQGTKVDVLIWNPAKADESHFDDWGRPIPDIWNRKNILFENDQLHVAASAQDEARATVSARLEHPSHIVSVDQKLNSLLASEIHAQGRHPYLPEGQPLIRCEAAKLALEWEEFRQTKDLRRLRRLLELPAFCRALDSDNPISQSDALIAVDHLLGKTIASTLDNAWNASPALSETAPTRELQLRSKIRRLLGSVNAALETSVLEFIELAFPETTSTRPESVERILKVGRELQSSPALSQWPQVKGKGQLPVPIFTQAIHNEQLQSPASESSITLNGWLEAPWLAEGHLLLCGLIEGQLPQTLDGDPFLPDSIRPALGLSYNNQRLARDSYLLDALLTSRRSEQVHLSFSKYNCDGDPNRPSRLLLRTDLDALPDRIQHVTQASSSDQKRPRRQTSWRWKLPSDIPSVEKISPTQFEAYLACPFRYCLEKVLRLDSGPAAAREMDAAVFGNLIHVSLENFGLEIIPTGSAMLQLDESHIRTRVQHFLKEEALRLFGAQPTPAVQVQLANAAARLNAFARVQAECFTEGWIIIEVEKKLDANDPNPLEIGSLKLSGIIDRIEKHVDTGALRVMDYKTYSSSKTPAETHLGPVSRNWLPEAQIELLVGRRSANKTWKNLQLPLYRKIIEHWYPNECEAHTPETAYFVLPSDPNDTRINAFEELNESVNPDAYTSAMQCAEAVANHITNGNYWPPQPFRNSWDDPIAPLLVNGTPEECIALETIEQLKGVQS